MRGIPPLGPRDRPASSRGFLFQRALARLARGCAQWPLADALWLLRIVTARLFMAHASTRFVYASIPQFPRFMEAHGLPHGELRVLAVTACEPAAGTLLPPGRGVRRMAPGLAAIAATGGGLIHRHNGRFVGEHGIDGSEYGVALLAMLPVVATDDAARATRLPSSDKEPT